MAVFDGYPVNEVRKRVRDITRLVEEERDYEAASILEIQLYGDLLEWVRDRHEPSRLLCKIALRTRKMKFPRW